MMIYVINFESGEEGIEFGTILQADEFGNFVKIINFDNEREFVNFIYEQIDAHNPKLVTYNKNNFTSLLIQKGLKYNLSGYSFFEKNNMMLNKTKWENYTTRYSDHYNINLADIISNYNSANFQPLEVLAKSLGLPQFQSEEEEMSQFRSLLIYIIFLKFEMLRGNILFSDYRYILDGLEQNLGSKSYFEPLIEFIKYEQN